MSRHAIAALVATLACLGAAAEVYKWVDEKGVTHYSESPPPDRKATRVETGPSVAPAPRADDWKEKALDARRRELERKQSTEAEQRKQTQEEAVRKGRCVRAQRELQVLEAQRPVYHLNERGEKVFVEDRDRPAEIARARREVEASCGR